MKLFKNLLKLFKKIPLKNNQFHIFSKIFIYWSNLYVVPTGIRSLSVWLQSTVKEVAVLAGICTSETLFIDGVLVVSASSTFS